MCTCAHIDIIYMHIDIIYNVMFTLCRKRTSMLPFLICRRSILKVWSQQVNAPCQWASAAALEAPAESEDSRTILGQMRKWQCREMRNSRPNSAPVLGLKPWKTFLRKQQITKITQWISGYNAHPKQNGGRGETRRARQRKLSASQAKTTRQT